MARLERGYYEDGRRDGIEEGKEEGIGEGLLVKQHEVARKMVSRGYDPDEIAGISGLSVEEIKKMQTNE